MPSVRRATLLAAIAAISLMGATCGGPDETPTVTPTPTPTPTATPAAIGVVDGSITMLLPWPTLAHDGKPLTHPWTGGPHAWNTDANSPCTSDQPCASGVPKEIRSGMDFGTAGGPDWDVYGVGPGTLAYKGSFGTIGFGYGVVTQHGDLFVLYAHMNQGSLDAAPEVGMRVDHGTKLGKTACSGCSKTETDHLHLELRSGMTFSASGVTSYGEHVKWDGRTIGGWRIKADTLLNYNGTATAPACNPSTITADVAGPAIYDASTCGGTAQTTPTPTPTPTASPIPVLAASWSSPKDGAKVGSSTLKLSAKAFFDQATESVSKVAFTIRWGSTTKKACTATKAGSSGAWSCKVDLWKVGAPLGKLTMSFDVTDGAGSVAKAPAGTRGITFAALPGAPSKVHLNLLCEMNFNCGDPAPVKVTWAPASGIVSGYRIYFSEVNDICAKTWTYSHKLKKLGSAGADARSWTGKSNLGFGRVVVVAYNAAGAGKGAPSREYIAMDFVCGG